MNSPLGEWDDEDQPAVVPEDAPPATVGGLPVDVAGLAQGLLDAMIQSEVRAQVRKAVSPLVAEAVAHALTPERLDELRERATEATKAELIPVEDADAEAEPVDAPPPLYYGSVDEFVRDFLVPVFSRQVGDRASRRWAAEWWRNPEAIVRLEALWRSWEHLRLDPATGMSVWLRDHADHHLGILWDPDGPFAKSTASARPGEPLPYSPPPEGLFPDVRVIGAART